MNIKKILKHRFVKMLLYFIGVTTLLILGTLWFLKIYTHHNRVIGVPDLYGLTIKDVQHVIKKHKLRYEIIDSVYQDDAKKGTVIFQNPPAGFNVKKDRKIYLTVNAHLPQKVKLPTDITGVTLRQAKATLESHGLYVGKIKYVPDMSNSVLKVSQEGEELTPGQSVLIKGSKVNLEIGNKMSYGSTLPPDLRGMKLRKARSILTNNSLNLGAVVYDENSIKTYKDTIDAVVWKQIPSRKSGKYIPLGHSVDVWLTVDEDKFNDKKESNEE